MKLYLVQHGLSLPEEKDPQRQLSEEGKEVVGKVAKFLKAKNIKVDHIWHSKKMRSVQTAQIIADSISHITIDERNDLNPMDSVDKFPNEFQKLNKDLMIVGHLPFLQKLASLLLTGSDNLESISFKYSGVICLECQERWKIGWFLTPDLV